MDRSKATPPASDEIPSLHRQAQQFFNRGQLGPAQQCCLKILQQDREHADALFLLGMISAALNRYARAADFVEQAVALAPDNAEYLAQLARCQALLKRTDAAAASAERALAARPQQALTLDTVGVVLSRLGRHQRAVRAFREAVAREPKNPSFQFNLGSSLKYLGDFAGAESAYEAAVTANPRFYKAYPAIAGLRRATAQRNHLQRFEELLGNLRRDDIDGELQLRHALAKELDDLGDYRRAFAHLAAGKRRKRSQLNYRFADDAALFAALEEAFPADQPLVPAGGEDSGAIFVTGMPRTGTTLVDRILSSHSRVQSAGELNEFGLCLKRAAASRSARVLDPDTVARARHGDLRAVGRAYLQAARRVAPDAPLFVDKSPLNFLYLGFLALAVPGARLICLRRHPLDTVLGNYRQLFALNFSYYNYAFDLEDTARYYLAFDRLIRHWRSLLGERLLEVGYEALVADQAATTRKLLDFCGLEWEAACLEYEHNTQPVATASAVQVREPINARAVGRWRQYAEALAPARHVLEAAGIELD